MRGDAALEQVLPNMEGKAVQKANSGGEALPEQVTNTSGSRRRRRRPRTASEKLEAIEQVNKGATKASVARDIDVPESTLRGWCKAEGRIRVLARNSTTSGSPPYSCASSSGQVLAEALSRESEGPSNKRMKLDSTLPGCSSDKIGNINYDQPSMDAYMTSILNSLAVSSVCVNNSISLQQIGLFSSIESAANIQHPLNLSGTNSQYAHMSSAQTVGLVENGLQYTRSSSSTSPSSTFTTNSRTRRSTHGSADKHPTSPRITNEYQNGPIDLSQNQNSRSRKMDCPEELQRIQRNITMERALMCGETFYDWLASCREPSVSREQIEELKSMIDNLKAAKKK